MSGLNPLPILTCRTCGRISPPVYLAPAIVPERERGTCICMGCAEARGWLDQDGNLKPGITL